MNDRMNDFILKKLVKLHIMIQRYIDRISVDNDNIKQKSKKN